MQDRNDPSDAPRPELTPFAKALIVAIIDVGARMSVSGNRDAEDAAQCAALSVCKGAIVGTYDSSKGTVQRFAFGVVLMVLMTQARGRARYAAFLNRYRLRAEGQPAGSIAGDGFETAVAHERASTVKGALDRLSPAEAAEVHRLFFDACRPAPATPAQKRLWTSAVKELADLLRPSARDYFGLRGAAS